MTIHQNLDQRRAGHAWQSIQQVKDGDDKAKKNFKIPDSTVFCVQALNPPSEAEM
jgi:hypothetical protein